MKNFGLLVAEECRASLDASGREILDQRPLPPAYEQEFAGTASHQVSGATAAVKPLCDLADALACVEAIIASCIADVQYTGLREAMRFSDSQKAEIAEAVQKIAANHAAVFAAHKNAIELGVALTAMQAAQLSRTEPQNELTLELTPSGCNFQISSKKNHRFTGEDFRW